MQKLQLPSVTLVAVTDQKIDEHMQALRKSMEGIDFGKVLLLSPRVGNEGGDFIAWDDGHTNVINGKSIELIGSIDEWNRIIIYELYKYVETDFLLLCHADGYVISPSLWNPAWLEYDYIGAPWPLPNDDYSYRTPNQNIRRVGNSVSLRSRRLMERVSRFPWQSYFGNTNEDGFISVHHVEELEDEGFKFAPLEVAVHFSKEHEIPENVGLETFAFHSL